jgi:hypothetical protein
MAASGGTKGATAAQAADPAIAVSKVTAWTPTRSSSMPGAALDAAGGRVRRVVPIAAVSDPGPGIRRAPREADVAALVAAVA